METKELCARLAKAAPKMTEDELEKLNATFPSYLFRRRRTREVWATCCGKHGVLPAQSPILTAEHTPEPRPVPYFSCHSGMMSAPPPQKMPAPAACPFCGKVSPVKELGRTGKRDNLCAYRRAVVLRWYRGALWGQAYYLKKSYPVEACLTDRPDYSLKAVYRFVPGKAVRANNCYGTWLSFMEQKTEKLTPKYSFSEPFTYCAEHGMTYDIVGAEEVDKSPFRWCGFEKFKAESASMMRYLALCTAYPRQVEMLTKAGLVEVVKDFVDRKKSNARAFDWNDPNPIQSFGLTRPELREFLDGSGDMSVLARYKSLKRAGVPTPMADLVALRGKLDGVVFDRVMAKLGRYRLTLTRLLNYLQREGKAMQGRKKSGPPLRDLAGWWSDYIDAAVVLGYDLKNPVFLIPKGLKEHHDKATKAATVLLESRRSAEAAEKMRRRCRSLTERYTYWDSRWLIRPPASAAEIVAEGKALRHCVGGYADRHIDGTVTILFLRDRTRPGRPLVTIEMSGATIVQIHGWDDECTTCKENPKRQSPRKLYAEFLEPWLAWLAAGSKRDKKGWPVMPKAKKESVA